MNTKESQELLNSMIKLFQSVPNPKEFRMHHRTYLRLRVDLPVWGNGFLTPVYEEQQKFMGVPIICDWQVPDDEVYLLPKEVEKEPEVDYN